MAESQATQGPGVPRSGVLVLGCWVTGRLPLIRATAWIGAVAAPTRTLGSRAQAHAALDAWLDLLGVD